MPSAKCRGPYQRLVLPRGELAVDVHAAAGLGEPAPLPHAARNGRVRQGLT